MKSSEAVKQIMDILEKVDDTPEPKAVVHVGMPLWDTICKRFVVVVGLVPEHPAYNMRIRYNLHEATDAHTRHFRSMYGLKVVTPEA